LSTPLPSRIHILLDRDGGLVAFQETGASWAGLPAFSSEDLAAEFIRVSGTAAAEIAAIDTDDPAAIAALVGAVKRRAIRHLLLNLDFRTGHCIQVEFEGDTFGSLRERQLEPPRSDRH
jgi:hypothetical protein